MATTLNMALGLTPNPNLSFAHAGADDDESIHQATSQLARPRFFSGTPCFRGKYFPMRGLVFDQNFFKISLISLPICSRGIPLRPVTVGNSHHNR